MTEVDIPDLGAVSLGDDEIDALLREVGYGVLSLAAGNAAYPVLLSFGYDGEQLYFAFIRTEEESTKVAFGERTEVATFLVHEIESKHRWRSAIARGSVAELDEDEWDAGVRAVRDNAWYPDLFASAAPTLGIGWWTLEPDEITGRKSAGYE